ncbi:MAG: sugar phosphate isomerase/epimerase [Phycisphaerae bacterium]
MELGCSLGMFGSVKLSESCAKATRAGFRYVELDWERVCREYSVESRRAGVVREILSEYDVAVAGVNVGRITAERTDQLLLQVKEIEKFFESIREIGAKLVILAGGARTLENFNYLREGLRTLADDAMVYGLDVAVANQIDTRLENGQDFEAVFRGLVSSNVGICADVYHCHLAAVNAEDIFRQMGNRIKLVRMGDLMGTVPVLPGQGEIEIKGLIRNLRKLKYEGNIVVDHLPGRDEKIDREVEQAYSYLQGIIS